MWPKRRSHAPDSRSDSSCATPRATMFGSRSVKPDIPARTFGSRYASVDARRLPGIHRYNRAVWRSDRPAVPRWCSISTVEGHRPRSSATISGKYTSVSQKLPSSAARGKDHEAIRHSLHLVETAAIGPVVQREHRERGIKCLRSEGKSLSRRLDYKRCLTGSLPDHVPR